MVWKSLHNLAPPPTHRARNDGIGGQSQDLSCFNKTILVWMTIITMTICASIYP